MLQRESACLPDKVGDRLAGVAGQSADGPGLSSYAGVLVGFMTTAPDGSLQCDPCADNTMLYIQHAMESAPVRASFDYDKVNVLLEPDNKLLVKAAAWLNSTGRPIHIEPTFTVVYRYEKAGE